MKCNVIVDQSDRTDIECTNDAVLSNEGVELCFSHANGYESAGLLTEDSKAYLANLRKYPSSFNRGDKVRIDAKGSRLHGYAGTVIEHIGHSTHVKLGKLEPGTMWFPWGYLVLDRSRVRYSRRHKDIDGWCVAEFHEGVGWLCIAHTGHLSTWQVLRSYVSFADEIRGGYRGCARLIGPGGIIAAEEDGRRKLDASHDGANMKGCTS